MAICSIALLILGETCHLKGRDMVTVWRTVLLLSGYNCDSTHQHYDVTQFEYVLWRHTMHEWVMNIYYKTWIAQGRFTNMILTPSKQWGVCDKYDITIRVESTWLLLMQPPWWCYPFDAYQGCPNIMCVICNHLSKHVYCHIYMKMLCVVNNNFSSGLTHLGISLSLAQCDMAFIEPMHRNKPNITYLLTLAHMFQHFWVLGKIYFGC